MVPCCKKHHNSCLMKTRAGYTCPLSFLFTYINYENSAMLDRIHTGKCRARDVYKASKVIYDRQS